jgi:pteridine reductase
MQDVRDIAPASGAAPLAGRTVLVTGGAHRVGGAVSRHLGELGARVVVAYHGSREAAEELAAGLPAGGLALPADLADPSAPESLLAACAGAGELPDAVVHAAASFLQRRALETTAEDWDRVFALNVRAFLLLAQAFSRRHGVREAAGSGLAAAAAVGGQRPQDLSLVAISDSGALELWTDYAVHCVSKAALLPLVQVLAKSLGPAVRVNAVLPGPVLPPPDFPPERMAAVREHTLLKRGGEPGDVATAVAFLLTNRYTTGTLLEVTGGAHLWRATMDRAQDPG